VLVAELQGARVEAADAERGPTYVCSRCKGIVILKQPRKIIYHFAHKPPTDCTWARGETRAHLEAKKLFRDALVTRGLRAELEYIVSALPGDRRADVMVWSSAGAMLAVELQHTSIGLKEIEARAFCYARAGMAQIWIPFLSSTALDAAEPRGPRSVFVERYSPRPFEKWVHGLNGKDGMSMYSPAYQKFWRAHLAGHQIYVEESSWFEQGGEERSAEDTIAGQSGIVS
jgi:hypothetical protein